MSITTTNRRLDIFDLPLDVISLDQTLNQLSEWIYKTPHQPRCVVTLNPEFIVQTQNDTKFAEVIKEADLITADGVGIVYAAKQLHGETVPRASGVDIAKGLMQKHGSELRVFFLGAQPGVAEQAAQHAKEEFEIQIAGVHHGYFKPEEDQQVAEMIGQSNAHLLLTGMGASRQEIFNQYWRQIHNTPVAIGCGGVIDVLGGAAELAPDWTRKAGLEWMWRIASDRSRWGRAPKLAKFVQMVQLEKWQNRKNRQPA